MSLFRAENISMRFGGVVALERVSFDVQKGEIFTIIGPNGAGKSTIFNLISRLYDPSAGTMFFENKNLDSYAPHEVASLGIARTFQNIELFEGASVLDNMLLGRHMHNKTNVWQQFLFSRAQQNIEKTHRLAVEKIIDFLHLASWRDKRIAELPYGVRKVVELGRALALEPKLILLDEPSSGLNREETLDMQFWIKDIRDLLNITIVIIEHDMTLVNAVSDRVIAINRGRTITTGDAVAVQKHAEVIRAYLGGDDAA
jgi:branched-chain amino acid transport system ATP-binding protein